MAAPLDSKVVLECVIEATPTPATSWVRSTNNVIESNGKYQATVVHEYYKIYMKLLIYDLNKTDYGIYKCLASNMLGQSIGIINLYGNYQVIF